MSLLNEFRRVNRRRRCPVCGKPDWCLVSAEGPGGPAKAVCARIESPHRFGEAGWLHRLRDDDADSGPRELRLVFGQRRDFERAARLSREAVDPAQLRELAAGLGVSAASLRRLGIGWHGRAWTFPMVDAHGHVIGIRTRTREGRKLAVRGSRQGLFVPHDLESRARLFACEGPTDTAALLGLGLPAIGRPSCSGGGKLVTRFVRERGVNQLVVAADADEPGWRGATALASVVRAYCPDVRVIRPPRDLGDVRAWVRSGATREDVLNAVEASKPVALIVRPVSGGGAA